MNAIVVVLQACYRRNLCLEFSLFLLKREQMSAAHSLIPKERKRTRAGQAKDFLVTLRLFLDCDN